MGTVARIRRPRAGQPKPTERTRRAARAQVEAHFRPWTRLRPQGRRGAPRRASRPPAPQRAPRLRLAFLLVVLIAAAPLYGLISGLGQTATLDPAPKDPYWLSHAPQERNTPRRDGYVNVDLVDDDRPLSRLWELGGFAPFLSSPVMDQEKAYVVDSKGNVSAINLTTGKLVWSTSLTGTVSAAPAVAYGWVYVATEGKKIHALSARTGQAIRTADLPGPAKSAPLVADGRVYQGTDAGIFVVLDGATLDKVWEFDTGTTSVDNTNGTVLTTNNDLRKPIRAAPSFHEGKVYMAAWNGKLYSLSATGNVYGNPKLFWEVLAGDSALNAAPAIDHRTDRVIVARGDGELHALKVADGTQAWKYDVGEAFQAGAAVGPERVVAGTTDGRMVGLDGDGGLLWDRLEPEGLVASPTLTNDSIVMLTARGRLELLHLDNGTTIAGPDAAYSWRLRDGAHTVPAVTNKGILVTDQSGWVTFIGPRPDADADLRAQDLGVTGALNPGKPLNVTVTVRNQGPDTAPIVHAKLYLDDMLHAEEELGRLSVDGTAKWTVPLTSGLTSGPHTLRAVFTVQGATDGDPASAETTLNVEIVEASEATEDPPLTIDEDGFPRNAQGEIDWDAFYAMGQEANTTEGDDGDEGNDTDTAGFVDGFRGAFGIWLAPVFLLAAAGGVFARAKLAGKEAAGSDGEDGA